MVCFCPEQHSLRKNSLVKLCSIFKCSFVFVTGLYLLWFTIEAIGREDNDNMAKWINSNSHDLATEKYFPEGHRQMWLWKLNGTNQLMHCGRGFSAQVLRVLPFDKITQIIYIIYLPVRTCTCYHPPTPPPPQKKKKKKEKKKQNESVQGYLFR